MGLIDTDEFTESLVDQYCEDCSKCNGSCRHDELMKLIDTQPTAYDVDKVVEQLKTDPLVKLYGSGNSDNYLIPVKRAIEIVKAGGIDER